MNKSKKLIFFGNERLATAATTTAPTLRALIAAGYEIEAVIASHTDSVSRQKRDLEIGPVAQAHNIPVILPGNNIPLVEKVKKHRAEAAVLVAYGQIIPQEVIDLFPKGIINIHPSLLPQYRGPTPIEQSILEGATQTGASLMKLVAKMDAGPVFAQAKIELSGTESKQELCDKLLALGTEMLIKHLPGILDGKVAAKEQDEAKASYTKLIKKDDGAIDFSKSAVILEREVRAYAGWPRSRAKIFGREVIVTKARIAKTQADGDLVIPTADGYLEIEELIAPSGRKMSGADFIRGYRKMN